jgi:hypothetical protein
MGAAREKGPADFDLERFIDMFDEALTSNDERVVNALRSLMMIVVLTKPEVNGRPGAEDRNVGPLRQMFDDQRQILRRLENVEQEIRNATRSSQRYGEYEGYRKMRDEWDVVDRWKAQDYKWTLSEQQHDAMKQAIMKINSPAAGSVPVTAQKAIKK